MNDIKFIQANYKNYKKNRTKPIEYIVIHYTAGNGDRAANNGYYFMNNTVKASAHYFVDELEYIQSVLEKDTAYHCGSSNGIYVHKKCRNDNSLSIELCSRVDNYGEYCFRNDTIRNAIELTKKLIDKYNIPIENVIRHYDVTGKICPSPMVKNEDLWLFFKNSLVDNEEEIYRIRKSWDDKTSQIGAFKSLENAINYCRNNYAVYNNDGIVIYDMREEIKLLKDDEYKNGKKFKLKESTYIYKDYKNLNEDSKKILEKSLVTWYGYYTTNNYYCVVDANNFTGYIKKECLEEC